MLRILGSKGRKDEIGEAGLENTSVNKFLIFSFGDRTSFYYSFCKFFIDGLTSALECGDTWKLIFLSFEASHKTSSQEESYFNTLLHSPYVTEKRLPSGLAIPVRHPRGQNKG